MEDLYRFARLQIALEGREGCSIDRLWELISAGLPIRGLKSLDNPKIKELIWQNGIVSHFRDILVFVPKKVCNSLSLSPAIEDAPEEYLEGMGHVSDVSEVLGSLVIAMRYGPKLVASEAFREGVLGLYEAKTSRFKISETQMKTLEAIAKTRHHGAFQSKLARELGVEYKNFFFVINCLLSRNLITKNATAVKKEQPARGMSQYSSTNKLHLKRFAPKGVLQMIKETDGQSAKSGEATFQIGDDSKLIFLICDTIWATENKTVVEHELKRKLGFCKRQGHRTWRRLQKKMIDSGLITAFKAIVDGSEVKCIRQLIAHQEWLEQRQLPKDMPPALNPETTVLVESTLDKQIYDMIYDAGAKGMTTTEIFNSLQLSSKVNWHRLQAMLNQQEVCVQVDNDGRSIVKRCFAKCFDPKNTLHNRGDIHQATLRPQHHDSWMEETMWAIQSVGPLPCIAQDSFDEEANTHTPENDPCIALEPSGSSPQVHPVALEVSEVPLHIIPKPDMAQESNELLYARAVMSRGDFRYKCLLKKIRSEKFILRNHVRSYLRDLELAAGYTNNKNGPERRCIIQLMDRLEKSIGAKRVVVTFPSKSTGAPRDLEVLVAPNIECTEGLLKEIREANTVLDRTSRQSQRASKVQEASVTLNVQRILPVHSQESKIRPKRSVASEQIYGHQRLLDNGFIRSKMIRTKLLHYLICRMVGLGGFAPYAPLVSDDSDRSGDVSGSHHISTNTPHMQDSFVEKDNCHPGDTEDLVPGSETLAIVSERSEKYIFTIEQLWKFMPIELFVQIVGTKVAVGELQELCHHYETLGDLSEEQWNLLMDETSASRLLDLIDILCRMELVDSVVAATNLGTELTDCSKFVIRKKGTLEEPCIGADQDADICIPKVVSEYTFAGSKPLDQYWTRLEYIFTELRENSCHCFPATKAPEVYSKTGWVTSRLMSVAQWLELSHRIDRERGTLDWAKCKEISEDLDLDYSQVLKLSRERQRRRRSGKRNAGEEAASESGDGTYSLSTAVDKGKQHNIRLSEKRIHPIRLKIRRAKSRPKKRLDLPVLPAWAVIDIHQSSVRGCNHKGLLHMGASDGGTTQQPCRRQWISEEDVLLLSAIFAWRCSAELPRSGPRWKKMVCLPSTSLSQCARRYATLRRKKEVDTLLEHMGIVAERVRLRRLERLSDCHKAAQEYLAHSSQLWGIPSQDVQAVLSGCLWVQKASGHQLVNEDQSTRPTDKDLLSPSDGTHQLSNIQISKQGQRLTGQKRKCETLGPQGSWQNFTQIGTPCEDSFTHKLLELKGKDGDHGVTEGHCRLTTLQDSCLMNGYNAEAPEIKGQAGSKQPDPSIVYNGPHGTRGALDQYNSSYQRQNALDLLIQHGHPEDIDNLLELKTLIDKVVSGVPRTKRRRGSERTSYPGGSMYTRELPDHMGLAIVENHKHLKQHWLPVCSKKKLGCADGPVTLCVARAKDLIISLLFHSETSESTAEAMGEHLKKTYEEKDILQAFRLLRKQGWIVHGGSQKPLRLSKLFTTSNTYFPSNLFIEAARAADSFRRVGSKLSEDLPSGCRRKNGGMFVTKDAEVIEGGFMACVTALLANESITLCPAVEEELEFQEQNTLHHDSEPMKLYPSGGSSESLVSVRILSSTQCSASNVDCGASTSSINLEIGKKRPFLELVRDARLPFSYSQVAYLQGTRNQAQIAFLDAVKGCIEGDHLLSDLAHFLLSVVRASSFKGITMEEIHLQAVDRFSDRVTLEAVGIITGKACWFELLQKVPGYDQTFYVASENAGRFMLPKHPADIAKESEIFVNQQSLPGACSEEDMTALNGMANFQAVRGAEAPTNSIDYILACPWIDHKGSINTGMIKLLQERLLAAMVAAPGISCESLCETVGFLNPATAANLLEKMTQQGLCSTRTIKEVISGPPSFFKARKETVIKTSYFPNLSKCFSTEYPYLPGVG